MKLTIGENIRAFRKKNDLTQEALADRLGVTYQSTSRWENGTTYPDLELLPAISEILSVTVDELLGMPQIEKEKRAIETYDELRRECIKKDYDADKIVTLLRDIRRNYLDSDHAWRPWSEGNDRAFRDPKILPEVRLLAEAYLERFPMNAHVIETMAESEDEEHLDAFLKKYTTVFDCSARALLFNRYWRRGEKEKFEEERRYQLYSAFDNIICSRCLHSWKADKETKQAAMVFMEDVLSLIRRDATDEGPDMWVETRLEFGIEAASRLAAESKTKEALAKTKDVVALLEETMKITEEVLLPTSCRFLDGMKWTAKEDWHTIHNSPDEQEERMIYISSQIGGLTTCYCVHPSDYLWLLQKKEFDSIRNHPEFQNLCERVKALIVTRPKQN